MEIRHKYTERSSISDDAHSLPRHRKCSQTLNMVIIKHYSLEYNEKLNSFYVKSREKSYCPYCEESFKVIGSRKRIIFRQDGSKERLIIRRLQCCECYRISHELPDIIIPYKRYESDVIADALDGTVSSQNDCCPAEHSTIQRWKIWFSLLHDYFEGAVYALMELMNIESFVVRIPLYPLSLQSDGWLKVLVRNLVNSGRWRQTRFA